ncbi:MAG: N-acetylmuramoyl-L-alanine amidase [Acidobacteriota bacterium]|nr:N-acetylmuramoyl-L-alanine amidase [Acidobacteriota bacterium]
MLQEAVAENLDVMRGVPPRALLRPARRWTHTLLRRAPLLLVPLTLAGSSYIIANNERPQPRPVAQPPRVEARMIEPATPLQLERVTASAFPLAVKRVVLDAGHGGSDPGAGAAGVFEKEITLDIGRRLRALLERNGFDVIVTREGDRTLALKDRARLANDSKSDIFVSIHVNALERHTESRGIETYYLGATNDPSLTALAASENQVSGYSVSDMRKLLEGVYADARRDESRELADAVQTKLYGALRREDAQLENWGVKRAPFLVLVATDMPAVLAEVGCISNSEEVAMLRSPAYRQQIADALFDGIRAYAGANVTAQKKGSEQNG